MLFIFVMFYFVHLALDRNPSQMKRITCMLFVGPNYHVVISCGPNELGSDVDALAARAHYPSRCEISVSSRQQWMTSLTVPTISAAVK